MNIFFKTGIYVLIGLCGVTPWAYISPMGIGDLPGETPLTRAIKNKNSTHVKLLITENRNSIANPNDAGWLPLQLAIRNGSRDIARYIIEAAPNAVSLQQPDQGYYPLHAAVDAIKPDLEIIELLIKNKAPLETKDKAGDTPLMGALGISRFDAADVLMRYGAKLDEAEIAKSLKLESAKKKGRLLDFLRKHNVHIGASKDESEPKAEAEQKQQAETQS